MQLRLCFVVIFFPAVVSPAGSLWGATEVKARLDTTAMRIGDPLTLTLTARIEPGDNVTFPELAGSLGEFELRSENPRERYEDDDGSALERQNFEITTFETGRQVVPPQSFLVRSDNDSLYSLPTDELPVTVISLVSDSASEVKPLKGLIDAPKLWHRLLWWALLAVAVLVLLAVFWRRYLKRREARFREKLKTLAPVHPAHLVALDALDHIKSMGLIEKGEIKLFHVLVSDVIRSYLEARFEVDALEMTSWEIDRALERKLEQDNLLRGLIMEFLVACDLVKFAKYRPLVVEINSVFNRAYEVVERSRPKSVAAAGPAENAPGPGEETPETANESGGAKGGGEGGG